MREDALVLRVSGCFRVESGVGVGVPEEAVLDQKNKLSGELRAEVYSSQSESRVQGPKAENSC